MHRTAEKGDDHQSTHHVRKTSDRLVQQAARSGLVVDYGVEYIAACEGTKDATWAQQFLVEVGITTILNLRIEPGLQLRLAESTQRAVIPIPASRTDQAS